ncbi:Imm26 family immunity protein [Clostridium manihotivorum]|uniref:Immunity protein 26 n=1 Tax=Clostridium manihotivorum TaxID=2320868 RepID=A0A3R5V665_9CLOT|nr:Imm26 family immunity protein [Clostridium manihotivorum]QAA31100.1 hypothetical protein C1I91_05160 [Clostridium manihotivorum]
MAKRIKYKIGDIFLIPLDEQLNAVAKVIKNHLATVFIIIYKVKPIKADEVIHIDTLSDDNHILMRWSYDSALKSGEWKIIGNSSVSDEFEMPYFRTNDARGVYYLIKGTDTHMGEKEAIEVSEQEAMEKGYPYGITNEIALPKSCMYLFKKNNML